MTRPGIEPTTFRSGSEHSTFTLPAGSEIWDLEENIWKWLIINDFQQKSADISKPSNIICIFLMKMNSTLDTEHVCKISSK